MSLYNAQIDAGVGVGAPAPYGAQPHAEGGRSRHFGGFGHHVARRVRARHERDGGRGHHGDREGGNKGARMACDFFIYLDVLASIAFIIAGLCPVTWIGYSTTTDSTTTNTSASIVYFSRTRTLWNIIPNSAQSAVNSRGWSNLDLAQGSSSVASTDYQYWNIIAMRRVEIAFFIIAVVLAGFALLVHIFCCIPSCRRHAGNGFWKNGIASGVLCGFAAAFQLIGMIVYQADIYYEAVYAGTNCGDCWSVWPSAVTTVTQVTFGAGYALGWCAAGLLVYGSVAYLSREFCVMRGCRAPEQEYDDDVQNLDAISGASSSAPYLKGTARDMQFSQVGATPRLQRYDVAAAPHSQPQPYYPNLYGRSDLVY